MKYVKIISFIMLVLGGAVISIFGITNEISKKSNIIEVQLPSPVSYGNIISIVNAENGLCVAFKTVNGVEMVQYQWDGKKYMPGYTFKFIER